MRAMSPLSEMWWAIRTGVLYAGEQPQNPERPPTFPPEARELSSLRKQETRVQSCCRVGACYWLFKVALQINF